MKVFKNVKDANHPFTMMSNDAIRDPNLSFKAKGLLLLILSLPDNWTLRESHMLSMTRDGRDSYHSGLKELEDAGYITKYQKKDDKGKFMRNEYIVYESLTYSCRTNQPIQDHEIRDVDIPLPDNSAYRTLSQSGEDLTDTPLTEIPQNNAEAPLTEVPLTETTPYINIECINNQPKKKTKTNTDLTNTNLKNKNKTNNGGLLFDENEIDTRKPKTEFTPDEESAYQDILEMICKRHYKGHLPEDYEKYEPIWRDTFIKLNRIDGYDFYQVKRVFRYVFDSTGERSAAFWASKTKGLGKLRNKDDDGQTIFARMTDSFLQLNNYIHPDEMFVKGRAPK